VIQFGYWLDDGSDRSPSGHTLGKMVDWRSTTTYSTWEI